MIINIEINIEIMFLQVYETLSNLRHEVGDARLTARTQRLLMLETLPDVQTFIETHRVFPLKRQTVVTCIDTLNKVNLLLRTGTLL